MTFGSTNPNSKLIKEDRWSRRYSLDSFDVYESKFAVDDTKIGLSGLEFEWESWRDGERLEFVRAFSYKSSLSGDDERIIEFLIHQEDEHIPPMMAILVILHSNKDLALEFLLQRIRSMTNDRENFFQALALLGDKRAVSVIRNFYQEGLTKIPTGSQGTLDDATRDFLMSSIALWKLTGDRGYLKHLQDLQNHLNERIRHHANLLYKIWCQK